MLNILQGWNMGLEIPVIVQERLGMLMMSSTFSQASGRGIELQYRHSEVFQVPPYKDLFRKNSSSSSQPGSFTCAGQVEQPGAPEDVPSDSCSACSEDVFITFTGYLPFLCRSSRHRALCFFLLLKAADPTVNHGSLASVHGCS